MTLSRRKFLKRAAITTTCAAFASLEYSRAVRDTQTLDIVEYKAQIPDLPQDFRGYRIGFLTDLHLGVWVPHEWIEDALRKVRDAKPDLFALGGDYPWVPEDNFIRKMGFVRNEKFADLSYQAATEAIYKDLADLIKTVRTPDGSYGVVGNHDRWIDPNTCFRYLNPSVVTLLVNQVATVQRGSSTLRIFGGDDYLTGIPKIPKLPKERGTVDLFISHNPDLVSYALRSTAYDFDLALCGHTHGGQVKLVGSSALTYAVEDQRFTSGPCIVGEKTVYTSRGIGLVEIPYRINCQPEVTIITLA